MRVYYFGLKLVVILTMLMILFSVLKGLLAERMTTQNGGGQSTLWKQGSGGTSPPDCS